MANNSSIVKMEQKCSKQHTGSTGCGRGTCLVKVTLHGSRRTADPSRDMHQRDQEPDLTSDELGIARQGEHRSKALRNKRGNNDDLLL
eukprot:1976916-Amphidinium_carterae.1